MKDKLIYTLIILSISLVAAAQYTIYDSGTVLNTSISNISMTFSVPVWVDETQIDTNSIILVNVTCTNGGGTQTSVLANVINTNKDSSTYCIASTSSSSSGRGRRSLQNLTTQEALRTDVNKFFIFSKDFISKYFLIGVLIILLILALSKRRKNEK